MKHQLVALCRPLVSFCSILPDEAAKRLRLVEEDEDREGDDKDTQGHRTCMRCRLGPGPEANKRQNATSGVQVNKFCVTLRAVQPYAAAS